MEFTITYKVSEKELSEALFFVNGKTGSDASVQSLLRYFFPETQVIDFDKMPKDERTFALNGFVANVIILRSANDEFEEAPPAKIITP